MPPTGEVNSPLQHQTVLLPPRGCFFWFRIHLARHAENAGGDTRATVQGRLRPPLEPREYFAIWY